MTSTTTAPTQRDLELLRAAIAESKASRDRGRHPFGTVIADADGRILLAMGNNSMPPGDPTQHAELRAVAHLAQHYDPQVCATATLYTSAEPCAMCSGGMYWVGIRRVVYGMSEDRLRAATGNHPENPTMSLPCRVVFESGQRPTEVVGPLLEDEAAQVHAGFWT